MKKITAIGIIPFSAMMLLAGCNDKEEVNSAPPVGQSESTENTAGEKEAQEKKAGFTYKIFNLDAEYEKGSYEVEFETLDSKTEASIDDGLENKKLEGDEAMRKLNTTLSKLNISSETPEKEVISEVVKAFGLNENYKDIELEIQYSDNKTKEYQAKGK
ncbi:hypothetical protein CVD28_13805 [Bacillus sp. M6-12]|uniref:YusW family protein n=1 Tax=Bacillus sp. M6-12 TaxID=2054166 RepID=UPI000C78110D|nr:YusW family protein [Bacillus sp. M6-12]PLS17124.1 hypothetical protein CVD28_13805 [Bacillus sp. M6-12]